MKIEITLEQYRFIMEGLQLVKDKYNKKKIVSHSKSEDFRIGRECKFLMEQIQEQKEMQHPILID